MTYRIREVDASDEEIAETIRRMNEHTDFPDLTEEDLDIGHWWLVYLNSDPVAFAGMMPSHQWRHVGYFVRAGVDAAHRGHGLQIRLMRVRINKARKLGYSHVVSDCTDTIWSANNFIRAGFKLYEPKSPWAFQHTLYWKKTL